MQELGLGADVLDGGREEFRAPRFGLACGEVAGVCVGLAYPIAGAGEVAGDDEVKGARGVPPRL